MAKTILFIEDDQATIEVYEIALKEAKFKVEAIQLGREAIERINKINKGKAKKPDLVLLDIILPDMNGIQILQEIRKQKETKDLPVFILTNYGGREIEHLGYKLKAEQYITKTNCLSRQLAKLVKERLKEK